MSVHVDPRLGHVTVHEDGRYPNGHYATITDFGHLIRTWKRTSTAIPAHVCEVAA